ncbi:MAG: cupin domain-containing protein [Rhizobiaceae bacterium]|nr:cupin domain-containing protein [Hyphomicrobiales bacterium]NRB29311.1 cupin domain-containing protein [Rhizobiaceae bacterium]
MDHLSASEIVKLLDLQPHPEGGFYKETFRDDASTAIYYLLEAGDHSHWHRVHGSSEIWHHYAGGPLALTLSPNGHDAEAHRLGKNINAGEKPQLVVPAGWWQTAESLGHWTLVGCTVAPGFDFENFEMAPDDWRPVPR